jgi:16S rRNA (guanine527-N7)-methyltransferase
MTKKTENTKQAMALGSVAWNDLVTQNLCALGVIVTPNMVRQIHVHVKDMLFWNRTTNLTSITDPYEVAVKHVIDSGAASVLLSDDEHVLDLGTGGGFPGIPLKIIRPSLHMTLVDSSRKKVNFVKQVIRELKLENTRAVEGRGEELAVSTDHQGRYDVVISRAFSGLDLFVPMALPFLKEGGRIIAMKGRDTDHEAELFQTVSIKMNDGTVIGPEHLDLEIRPYGLPGTDFQRAFMIVRREK